jgi:hypothetical protein
MLKLIFKNIILILNNILVKTFKKVYFNKRIMNEKIDDKKYKRQLVFGGTGGMYNYSLGIASVIQ